MSVGSSSLPLVKNIVKAMLSQSLLQDSSYVNHILVRLFVLAHHPKLPRHQWSWVDIARLANVDPGNLATTCTIEFMRSLTEKSWPTEKVQTVSTFSYNRTLDSETPLFRHAERLLSLVRRMPFHC